MEKERKDKENRVGRERKKRERKGIERGKSRIKIDWKQIEKNECKN